jgi:enoyl-CoA hydratase/carnithine racemase
MTERVRLEWPQERLAIVTVDDPATPNHNITFATVSALADRLSEARKGGARVTVLASAVPGQWLNHAHLGDLSKLMQGKPTSGDPSGWFRAPNELANTDVVTIAAISGNTSGGGCELGWACDLRIAEEGVLFSQPEVIIGVGTGIGGTCRLRRLIGRAATAEMVLTGRPMSAERIYQLGGINRVVPKGQAIAAAVEIARHMVGLPAYALAGMKQMLREDEDLSLVQGLENDQKLSQIMFRNPAALRMMEEIQGRYDARERLETVLWGEQK